MKIRTCFSLVLILFLVNFSGAAEMDILSIEAKLISEPVQTGGQFSATVDVHLQDEWHLNSNRPHDEFLIPTELRISASDNYKITNLRYPKHILKRLAFSDQPLAIFEGTFSIQLDGVISTSTDSIVTITGALYYQGCNDQMCLPPNEIPFSLKVPVRSIPKDSPNTTRIIQSATPEAPSSTESVSEKGFAIGDSLAEKGFLLTFLLIFLGGLGLNLTPCVYPLIPVTLSYFGGQTVGHKGKILLMALLYILGLALVNSLLGTLAALSGGLLGAFMTNPIVLITIAGIMVAMALSMFGLYEFGAPNFLLNLTGGSRSGYFGALFMGLTMGVVAAPCIGPFVIGLLTYVAAVGKPLFGFLMFFTLSLGLGLPFLILAFFAGKIDRLPRSGEWMVGVRQIFGFILIGMALYFIKPLFPPVISARILWLYAIISGVYLILFSTVGNATKGFAFIKNLLAIVAILIGSWFLKPEKADSAQMQWEPYTAEAFETARQDNRPIMLDFYADWCIPCIELDKYTFSDPEVVRLSEKFALFKIDLTGQVTAEVQTVRQKYNIKGVPTIVFIAADGREFTNLRLLGFEKAAGVVYRMQQVLNQP